MCRFESNWAGRQALNRTNKLRPERHMWTSVCFWTAVLLEVHSLFLWNESQWLVKYKLWIHSRTHENTVDFGWIVLTLNVSTSLFELTANATAAVVTVEVILVFTAQSTSVEWLLSLCFSFFADFFCYFFQNVQMGYFKTCFGRYCKTFTSLDKGQHTLVNRSVLPKRQST